MSNLLHLAVAVENVSSQRHEARRFALYNMGAPFWVGDKLLRYLTLFPNSLAVFFSESGSATKDSLLDMRAP